MRRTLWTVLIGACGIAAAAAPAWAVTGNLEITAATSAGQSLPGATITLTPEDPDSEEKTVVIGPTGSASLTLETGRYRYRVRRDGHDEQTGAISIGPGENRLDLTLVPTPSRPWGFDVAGGIGSIGDGSISGQGFTKPETGPESRILASPDGFSVSSLELRSRLGRWFAGYERSFGDAQESAMAGPGRNGDLFLGVNERGNNGRIFTGFAAEESIALDFEVDRFQLGARLPFSADSWQPGVGQLYVGAYGYFEMGRLDYLSEWNVSLFPDARSRTEQRLMWDVFGIGLEARVPVARFGPRFGLSLAPGAWIGKADYEYRAEQLVANPPGPEQEFSAADQVERTAWGADVELIVSFEANPNLFAELVGRVGVRTLPTVEQVSGDQLEQGQQDGLDFVSPREYFLGARLRF